YVVGYSGEGVNAQKSADPNFSYDASHIIFLISQSKAEVDSLKNIKKNKNKKKTVPKKLAIMNLADGNTTVIDSVKSYSLPKEAGGWLAYLKEAPVDTLKKQNDQDKKQTEEEKKEDKSKKKKEKKDGTRLVLRFLADANETIIEYVSDYRFLKKGEYLLYITSNKQQPETDGVYAINLKTHQQISITTGAGNYKKWTLDKAQKLLAVLSDRDDYEAENPTFNLYGWKVGAPKAELWVSHASTRGFPAGLAVSDKSTLSFSEDGQIIMFGVKEIPEAAEQDTAEVAEDEAKFELWHWNDPYPQPQQKKMAQRVRDNTYQSVYFLNGKKFVQLADKELPEVRLARLGKWAYANHSWPYTKLVSWDGAYNDVYLISPANGERTLVKSKLYGSASLSPNEKYLYWFEDNHWFIHDIRKKTAINVTQQIEISFALEDWDTPRPARPYGIAGWTDDDKSVLIYDRYDIWELAPNGSKARMITEGYGRENDLCFRYINLDPEKKTINPKEELLLYTTNEETMASGFYSDRVSGNERPQRLLMAEKNFERRSIQKAKNQDRVIFSRSSFDEFPDIWFSDLSFANPQKITDLGSQIDSFLWGKAELIDFLSADNKPLKGILIKPEDFDPNQQYPLMVYIYETLHDNLHRFWTPSPGTSINPSYYISNGYIIWMPDIEYDTGYPGQDALKCVLPGIQMLIRDGYINEKAVGIQGHSWGGYQIAYMITQTNIFAAAEAGAPVSNMISAYGGIRWSTGMVRQFQYEKTQSRIGASLWEAPLRYIENSPIFWADKVQTPLLMMHNDDDGAVPWYQGIEYMMALRRLEKEAYMLNYNGEKHGLRKRVNQMDWTIRMAEFFDHHLKAAPAPEWMTEGIHAWDKKKTGESKN
ncbi:MAG TPA: S9 family peptidase, partial [bacterium]|nr:S9 family peptidase [bacterium]